MRVTSCHTALLYNKEGFKMPKTNRNKYPLRKIIQEVVGRPWLVILECGHTAMGSTDIYGRTHPTRQRCRLCYELKQNQ